MKNQNWKPEPKLQVIMDNNLETKTETCQQTEAKPNFQTRNQNG